MTSPEESSQASSPQAPSTFTEEWLPGPASTQFYTRTYAPAAASPRAVVLFVHGFAEYVGRYAWAHGVYAARGIAVVAFDQRGFGRTGMDAARRSAGSAYCKTSFAEQLADIEWAVRLVRARMPGLPLFLMGHSMGGGLALAFAARAAAPSTSTRESIALLSGVVATSPLLVQTAPVPRPVQFVARMVAKVFPMLLVPAPVDSNLLVVHGTADKVTSYAASQEFFSKVAVQDKEFKSFEDGYHELVHEPSGVKEKFVDECIAWILARTSSVIPENI
uniref:Protein kinase C (EC) n=1 Tax=Ganoderma boninense TaxID=34458 RepID=A0A5K1K3D4_9APHY|nr:Protein kinase C (EC [Ganoderma boninense]